jgi:two-component system CheB/CheR fusion protein
VIKSVRDCLVFAKQDVTKDPPFSKVDLISCRNLLIYMDSDLQQRLMPLFHYAINPSGYLFLGSSETVGGAADLFAPIDKKWKLFQRRDSVKPRQIVATTMPPRETPAGVRGHIELRPVPLRVRVRELAEKTLLEKHVPACAVINAEGDILYIHGHTGRYLELAPGEPSGSIYKMARDGLRLELSTGVRKALVQNEPVRYERLHVRTNGDTSLVNLTIEPMPGPDAVKGVMLVIFEDVIVAADVLAAVNLEPLADREQRIADLDRELSAKEEYLRTAVEELETSNEELKSTNEEMQSTNEELQSTNEELETSREELQSVNEELVTVNSELGEKITELSHANNDMNNMLAGTGIGTLFVDRQQLIQRFTPRVTDILRLIPTDVGRPLGDIASRIESDVSLVDAVATVLDTLATVAELIVSGERIYQMRAQPYRTVDSVIEGVVLTFVDVTEQTHTQARLDEVSAAASLAGVFAQSVLDTVREPQLVLDGELKVVTANMSFMDTFQLPADEIVGLPLGELYDGAWLTPDLSDLLLKVLPTQKNLEDYQLVVTGGSLGQVTITLNALELVQTPDKQRLILLTVTDMGAAT